VIFSGEAYNVEQGKDTVNYELTQPQQIVDDASNFANFMRFLAPPVQVSSYGAVTNAQIVARVDVDAPFNLSPAERQDLLYVLRSL